jgi:hypothetical protein
MITQTTRRAMIMGMVWTLAFAALVAAQQPTKSGKQTSPSSQHGGAMPAMDDMMKMCQTHCQATTTAIDQLTATLKEARESNDPARMQTALDQAQQPLAEMKNHIGECMNMMSMMQQMHGGMGGAMKGKQK